MPELGYADLSAQALVTDEKLPALQEEGIGVQNSAASAAQRRFPKALSAVLAAAMLVAVALAAASRSRAMAGRDPRSAQRSAISAVEVADGGPFAVAAEQADEGVTGPAVAPDGAAAPVAKAAAGAQGSPAAPAAPTAAAAAAQAFGGQQERQLLNWKMFGEDLLCVDPKFPLVKGIDPDECASLCAEKPGCNYFSYSAQGIVKQCHLARKCKKTKIAKKKNWDTYKCCS